MLGCVIVSTCVWVCMLALCGVSVTQRLTLAPRTPPFSRYSHASKPLQTLLPVLLHVLPHMCTAQHTIKHSTQIQPSMCNLSKEYITAVIVERSTHAIGQLHSSTQHSSKDH